MKILVFDSTEKCAGTSLKHFLRLNFPHDCFFDLDNGDPPNEVIRNYGIDCPIRYDDFTNDQLVSPTGFYSIFNSYINERANWLINNVSKFNLKCIYGNGINSTNLLTFFKDKCSINSCKFFRNTTSRIAAEYFYVLNHKTHNLHPIASSCSSFEKYILHPERPRNRLSFSLSGNNDTPISDLFYILENHFFFLGLVENFKNDLFALANLLGLKFQEDIKRNKNKFSMIKELNLCEYDHLTNETDLKDSQVYEKVLLIRKNNSFYS